MRERLIVGGDAGGPEPRRRHKWRRRLKRLAIGGVVAVVLFSLLAVGAEYYTSRPQFCGSCHIMDPYYVSWEHDIHSSKAGAICVDCHYAPGEQHTFHAKFRGLSQAASYFSGRAGGGRPKAKVNDASCLRSGCHADRKYMDKEVLLGKVKFKHSVHLNPNSESLKEKQADLEALTRKVADALPAERFREVESLAGVVQSAEARNEQLGQYLSANGLEGMKQDVLAYAEALHTEARIAQLSGLKCAGCHQFDSSERHHFITAKTTCYTCHFMNQSFNANTGRCMGCHEPPTTEVMVHGGAATTKPGLQTLPGGEVTMNHTVIVANKVDCVSCHADLIRGTGRVTRRDCENCHDQQRYLKDFDHPTTQVVRDYHRAHTAAQRARCNDCHQLIQHQFAEVGPGGDVVATTLSVVRQDCQHCHPDHHEEQVEMLLGYGGYVGEAVPTPNQMASSRVNCRACHMKAGEDPKGDAVTKSTKESCKGCHSEDYETLYAQWKEGLAASLGEAEKVAADVERRLSAASQPAGPDRTEAEKLLKRARLNIHLVATANGLHNKNYATMLLDQALADLGKAEKLLGQ
jgi:nitrate/TMAO reductase-like tetraheme cytochrome c subunit